MWRKVKTFFHVFQGSLFPQPAYYHKITKASILFSFKYFIVLIFTLNCLFASFFVVKYNPFRVKKFLNSVTAEIASLPKELTVNINDGNLFTNYNHPYFFWLGNNGSKSLLLVVDENAGAEKINIYNTYILVTGREISFKNNLKSDDFKTIPLKSVGKHIFSKKDFEKTANILTTINKFLYLFYLLTIPLLFIFLPLLSFLITLFYLTIISLIVYLFFKTYYHKRIYFKKTLQLAFHAVTLPLIIVYLLNIFQPTISTNIKFKFLIPSPLTFLIVLLIFVFAAVYEAYIVKHHTS